MELGIVGKPNAGKSTFFEAVTMVEVSIANYPFTTIKPNIGTTTVTAPCPCKELGIECNPQNSSCVGGVRHIPVEILDVAGLVPGAHEGRGLGNQFLDDLRRAKVLIHVLDMSGQTDSEGKQTENHDPAEDVKFLENEVSWWIAGILEKNWRAIERKAKQTSLAVALSEQLAGLGVSEKEVESVLKKTPTENLRAFSAEIRKLSKPIILAANKMDLSLAREKLAGLKSEFQDSVVVPCSAAVELALRKAATKGLVDYTPGEASFSEKDGLSREQKAGLEKARDVMEWLGGTGTQDVINKAVFELLGLIVVYTVEDETHFSDSKGNVLPDAKLVPKGTTAKELAYLIHTDIGEKFIYALDARTKRRIAADHELKSGDIIKIASAA